MTDVNAAYMPKFNELTALSIDEQTKVFLKAFVVELAGKFEQVYSTQAWHGTVVKLCPQCPSFDAIRGDSISYILVALFPLQQPQPTQTFLRL